MADGFARVFVEVDWWDGPRAGLVDIDGEAHYFWSRGEDFPVDHYLVWPASDAVVAMEREQWEVFVRWNQRREAGLAGIDSHPGHGGIDARYDELTALLAEHHEPPAGARVLVAEWRFDDGERYRLGGLGYWVRWTRTS